MPQIDQLAPATSASDTDELIVNQSGVTRKITRAQVIAGLQPQLSLPGSALLGRSTPSVGNVETISLGSNLILNNGTLSAGTMALTASQLPSGTVPVGSDLVVVSQGGKNVSISYSQFMSSISKVSNVDVSQTWVKPSGSTALRKLSDFAASALTTNGSTLIGPLVLAGPPSTALQAATKDYVDKSATTALPRSGGSLTGPLSLSGEPTLSGQAATKNYVDGQVAKNLPKTGGTLAGALILSGDPASGLQAATRQYVDARLSRAGDTMSGALVLAGTPSAALHAASKSYVDGQVQTAVPNAGGTMTGSLFLAGAPVWPTQAANKNYVDSQVGMGLPRAGGSLFGPLVLSSDPVTSLGAATKQYVEARLLRNGDTLTGPLTLAGEPAASREAANKGYVDAQFATAVPKSGGTLTGLLSLSSDPTAMPHAATKRYVDAQTATTLPLTGGTLSGSLILAAAPQLPNGATTKQYVDGQLATLLPIGGGTLTGGLTLAGNPSANMHASTKQYVDGLVNANGIINVKAAPYNAQLNGVTDDTAAFASAYQAATVGSTIRVPSGTTVLRNPNAWNVPLTKGVKWVVDGTKLADGTSLSSAIPTGTNPANLFLPGIVEGYSASGSEFSKASSSSADLAVLHSSYIVNHSGGSQSVITNSRTDTIIYNSPATFTWSGLDRLIWAGVQTPTASTPAQHVGRYVQTIRQSIATNSSGVALPQPELWAACLEYRDVTGKPSSWSSASLTIEMDWIGNGADDRQSRQIQSCVLAQHDPAGAPVEISTVIGVYLAAGSAGHAYRVFNVGIPFSTAVLDTTASTQLPGAAAIRMAAGHSIAFEPTAVNALAFDSATGTLRWNQGTASYVVGKGLAVGWANVCTSNTTLPSYTAGNIVFLVGGTPYTVTLPSAASTPAGTGFTFSVLGGGPSRSPHRDLTGSTMAPSS